MPTLDSSGWVSDPPNIVNRILTNFFVANHSQTVVHWGKVYSLPFIIAENAEDDVGLKEDIKTALSTMLRGYFTNVTVDIDVVPFNDADQRRNVIIDVLVNVNDATYSLGKLLTLVKDNIIEIKDK